MYSWSPVQFEKLSATLPYCNSSTTLQMQDYLKFIIMEFLCFVRGYSIVFHLIQSTEQRKMTAESGNYSSIDVCLILLSAHTLREKIADFFFSKIRFQEGNSWLAKKTLVRSPFLWIHVNLRSIKFVCTKNDETKLWSCKTMLLGSDYIN